MYNKIKINKNDYNRALVTETIPFETPIIFSNDGFYINANSKDKFSTLWFSIFSKLIEGSKKTKFTIPYTYKIKKNDGGFRKLSLPHPLAQYEMKEFYRIYGRIINYYCSKSKFSIRAPVRIASTYYHSNPFEDRSSYKRSKVATVKEENLSKHSSSYFGYNGYDRIYKFYSSSEFILLESNFPNLYTLDVTRCFDSIYTHTISWATKNKDFTKKMLGNKYSSFGEAFDKLMQRSNYNETNGLIVGPEISRVFAEIIFQKIDSNVENKLSSLEEPIIESDDYKIRRYVDDIFIFARSESIARNIHDIYADELSHYNMHINIAKVNLSSRPFLTGKSKVILSVSNILNDFIDKFLDPDDLNKLVPKKIFKPYNLINAFIERVKISCHDNNASYNESSSYIISSIFERIKRLTKNKETYEEKDMYHAFVVLFSVSFFFYKVSPSMPSSYKLSSMITVISEVSKYLTPSYTKSFRENIFTEVIEYLSFASGNNNNITNVIDLENFNILCAIGDLDEESQIPEFLIRKMFSENKSYYSIIVFFYLTKDSRKYRVTRDTVIQHLESEFSDLTDILISSEKAHLFLDLMSCPYIDDGLKISWLKKVTSALQIGAPSKLEINVFLNECTENPWFVKWGNIDLLNMLEKKQLKKTY